MLETCVQIVEKLTTPISAETWQSIFSQWQGFLAKEYLIPVLAQNCELTLRLTDDTEIQALNRQFRQVDRPTDVLAFASLEVDAPLIPDSSIYLGDIIISVTTAEQRVQLPNWTISHELMWLASHGLLHLLGWDHPDQPSLEVMWSIQEQLLQIGLAVTQNTYEPF